MKKYLEGKKIIIELGSGNGCIKKIINNKNIILNRHYKISLDR